MLLTTEPTIPSAQPFLNSYWPLLCLPLSSVYPLHYCFIDLICLHFGGYFLLDSGYKSSGKWIIGDCALPFPKLSLQSAFSLLWGSLISPNLILSISEVISCAIGEFLQKSVLLYLEVFCLSFPIVSFKLWSLIHLNPPLYRIKKNNVVLHLYRSTSSFSRTLYYITCLSWYRFFLYFCEKCCNFVGFLLVIP